MTPEYEKPSLPEDTISLAFQFRALEAYNLELFQNQLNPQLQQCIRAISAAYEPPLGVPRRREPYVRRGRSVSVDQTETSGDPITFPKAWAAGKGARGALNAATANLRRAVKEFISSDFFEDWSENQLPKSQEATRYKEITPGPSGPASALPIRAPSFSPISSRSRSFLTGNTPQQVLLQPSTLEQPLLAANSPSSRLTVGSLPLAPSKRITDQETYTIDEVTRRLWSRRASMDTRRGNTRPNLFGQNFN